MKTYTNVAQLLKSRERCRHVDMSQFLPNATGRSQDFSWEGVEWGGGRHSLNSRCDMMGVKIWTFIAIVQPKSHFHSPWFSNGGCSQYFTK